MKIKAVLFDLYGTLVGFEPSRFVIQSQVATKYDLFLTEEGVSKGYFLADKFMAEQNAVNPIRSMPIVEKDSEHEISKIYLGLAKKIKSIYLSD